jgi:hypothetical protein
MDQNAKDIEIINRHADDLNEEALDVLDYQYAMLLSEEESWPAHSCLCQHPRLTITT